MKIIYNLIFIYILKCRNEIIYYFLNIYLHLFIFYIFLYIFLNSYKLDKTFFHSQNLIFLIYQVSLNFKKCILTNYSIFF